MTFQGAGSQVVPVVQSHLLRFSSYFLQLIVYSYFDFIMFIFQSLVYHIDRKITHFNVQNLTVSLKLLN